MQLFICKRLGNNFTDYSENQGLEVFELKNLSNNLSSLIKLFVICGDSHFWPVKKYYRKETALTISMKFKYWRF